jgi:hypothetical protein
MLPRLAVFFKVTCPGAYARVAVHGVVPGKEALAMHTRILDAAEACGEVGAVLHGFEVRFRVRVVVRDVRPTMVVTIASPVAL